jgi:8-oxo-dGTP pyrophosphatase MutT (NUDIX family)
MGEATRTTSVGYLCIARDLAGAAHVLLGREKELRGWASGSNLWSTFSGRLERNEDPPLGAAREFLEESLCVVSLGQGDERRTTPKDVADIVKNLAMSTVEYFVRGRTTVCRSLLYIVQIPYDDELPRRFRALRRELEALAVRERVYSQERRRYPCVPSICCPGYHLSPSVVVSDVRIQGSNVCLQIWDGAAHSAQVLNLGAGFHLSEVQCVLDARTSFLADVRRTAAHLLDHPAVKCTVVAGELLDLKVNHAYLEKSEIAWWPLERLRGLDASQLRHFRPHFAKLLPDLINAAEPTRSCDVPEKRAVFGEDLREEVVVTAIRR